jgi:hypothetical protein
MTEQTMNGVAETLPHATELILSNGLKCWVYPVSARDRMRLIQAFNEKHPQPDKKTYERPVPADEASFENQTYAADSNPEYQLAQVEWREQLSEYVTNAFLVGYTEFPDNDEQDLISKFARVIKRKRRVMELPADEWEATLCYALLDTPDDQRMIISAIESRLPVEWEGIIDQVAIFRPVDQQHAHSGLSNGQSETQGAKQEA